MKSEFVSVPREAIKKARALFDEIRTQSSGELALSDFTDCAEEGLRLLSVDDAPAAPVAGEDAHQIMQAFYLSNYYDPKAKRHADVVEAAIKYALAALTAAFGKVLNK